MGAIVIWRKRTMLVWDYSCLGFVDLNLKPNSLKQSKAAYAVEEARTIIHAFLYPAQGGLLKSIYPTTSIPPSLCSVRESREKRKKHHTQWKETGSYFKAL